MVVDLIPPQPSPFGGYVDGDFSLSIIFFFLTFLSFQKFTDQNGKTTCTRGEGEKKEGKKTPWRWTIVSFLSSFFIPALFHTH